MRFFKMLLSVQAAMVLLIVLAFSCAGATFIEARYGAETARALVYDALWFELLFVLIAAQLMVQILHGKLWKSGKRLSLLIHLAILLILSGCGLTRHFGFQGVFHLREGETGNRVRSAQSYLSIRAKCDTVSIERNRRLLFSPFSKPKWTEILVAENDTLTVSAAGWVESAEKRIEPAASSGPVIALQAEWDGKSRMLILEAGDAETFGGVTFGFDAAVPDTPRVTFSIKKNGLVFASSPPGKIETASDQWMMISGKTPLVRNRIAAIGSVHFVLRDWAPNGTVMAVPSESEDKSGVSAALALDVSSASESRRVWLFNVPGEVANPKRITMGRFQIDLAYGLKSVALPFSLRLDDFTIERYPGSMKPSGFASQVMVLDAQHSRRIPYRISMNHILKYRGYRFYQSDFDTDERGSILTVARDPGMILVYAGFAMLGFGLIWNLFHSKGRFRTLDRLLKHSGIWIIAAMLWTSSLRADAPNDPMAAFIQSIDPVEARRFADLLTQDGGRIKPVGTLARELAQTDPELGELARLGVERIALAVFVRPELFGADEYDAAPAKRLRLFPKPKDPSRSWFAAEDVPSRFPKVPADSILKMIGLYRKAVLGSDREAAALAFSAISNFQRNQGGDLIPSPNRLKAEKLYNDLDPFRRLWPFLAGLGLILTGTVAVRWLTPRLKLGFWMKTLAFFIAAGFVIFTAGMALRWIVSGHAPWSNRYESVLYIAWAVLAAGMLSFKHSRIGLGLSAWVSGMFLWAGHRFMDPSITTLPPVLKSPWLVIHVSVITASYGFFILGALIAATSLSSLTAKSKTERIRLSIRIRTMTVERSLIVGLTLLLLGNGLGALWANESWGRYWGWDPKETWTLVTLLCYAITLHLRLIPRFNTPFWLNAGALVSFGSVIMTYFVIVGMHSYAAGNSTGFPVWIYTLAGLAAILIALAAKNGRTFGE